MPGVDKKYIIDTSSLISYLDYYYFDKNNGGSIYTMLKDFLIDKINSGEIIVIDKVVTELRNLRGLDSDFRDILNKNKKDSLPLFNNVSSVLIPKYRIYANQKNMNPAAVNNELDKYENKYADLYLIAYSNSIKSGNRPVIITEEGMRPDRKLIDKIPTICKAENEDIEWMSMPKYLFDVCNSKLIFDLNITP